MADNKVKQAAGWGDDSDGSDEEQEWHGLEDGPRDAKVS